MAINTIQLLQHLDMERRTLSRSGETIEQCEHLTRLTSADGSQHTITFSHLNPDNADDIIAEQVAHYRKLNVQLEWKVYAHDPPADLLERLGRFGFDIGPGEAVGVLDLHEKHDWLDAPLQYRVERVSSLDAVELYRRTAQKIFNKDYGFTAGELSRQIVEGKREHFGYIGFSGDLPVSIGRLYLHADSIFGGLYGGATLPEYRRAGFYRSVTAARARDARAANARFLMVDALPASARILKQLGFIELTQTWPCVLHRRQP